MVTKWMYPPSTARHPALVQGLLDPAAYPHPVHNLHMRQTHVSWLFFTGDYVYKVKKPVNLGFLDFTTLAKRRHFCRREVELNRRISPGVYLGVVSVSCDKGRFRISGGGPAVEYAVWMHQLPEEKTLAALLQNNRVQGCDMARIAQRLARFHDGAATRCRIEKLGDLDAIRFNVEENFDQTRRFVGELFAPDAFDDIVGYSRAFMQVRRPLFERRAGEAGHIRDGHGDLHCSNIFLIDGIEIVDCIEFNDRFRCLDVAEDIAFLAMDLDHFGRTDLSQGFLDAYIEATEDLDIRQLIDFFKVYRAYVRAKVNALGAGDPEQEPAQRRQSRVDARSYFGLAHKYTHRVWDRPRLVVMFGLMGSGKTTLAEELARRWRLEYLSSDLIRKELAGLRAKQHAYLPYGRGIYSAEFTRKTYQAMSDRALRLLASSRSVVLDASFQREAERRRLQRLAEETRADLLWVECRAPERVLRERLEHRLTALDATTSDGRPALLERHMRDWEPLFDAGGLGIVRVDTNSSIQATMQTLIEQLFARKLKVTQPSWRTSKDLKHQISGLK